MRRQMFKIPIIVLAALWLIYLISLVSKANILESGINALFLLAAAFYLVGGYLITKQRLLKIIGVVLILAAVFITLRGTIVPNYSVLAMLLDPMILVLTMGMGIFMVTRQGIGLRLFGVGLVVATIAMVLMGIFTSIFSPVTITGNDKTIILASVEPRINDFVEAWNNKDYKKLSQGLTDKFKSGYGQNKFMSNRTEVGKLILESGSSTVIYQTLEFKVSVPVALEKYPLVPVTLLTVSILASDKEYLITRFTVGTVNTNSGTSNPTTSPTATYLVSMVDPPNTGTTKNYQCSSPSYNYNQAKALIPSDSLIQRYKDEGVQANSDLDQLDKMGSPSSTNNYNTVLADYNTQDVAFKADQKQIISEQQSYNNYIKTNCTYVGN